jgi:RNA-directed DNA polymerase
VEKRGCRTIDLEEGQMDRTSGLRPISTRLRKIAKLAREGPDMVFSTIAHHIDICFLHEAYRKTSKNTAAGVDEETAEEYKKDLNKNLTELLERFKSGRYRAPPVKRVYIPKGDSKIDKRPIGIPCFEDKILQRAVKMILEPIYEQDFYPCSYGYRPGRSCHQMVEAAQSALMKMGGGWILEVDIKGYFDSINHQMLRKILDKRVSDGVIRKVLHKWLNAGIWEKNTITYPEEGTPQGDLASSIKHILTRSIGHLV